MVHCENCSQEKWACRLSWALARGLCSLQEILNGLWRQWRHRSEQASQLRHLLGLDDRLLKDIGLSRADAERIAGVSRFDRPEEIDQRYRTGDRSGS